MKCKNYKTRTKTIKGKRTIYNYCTVLRQEINYDNCRNCAKKEFKIPKSTIFEKNSAKYDFPVKMKTIKGKKHKLTKATEIPMKVKRIVWERDKGRCVICGNTYNVMPNAHYIRRSKGGLGIEQNIFTACTDLTENKCHSNFDKFGIGEDKVIAHFKKNYENWNKEDLKYKKKR